MLRYPPADWKGDGQTSGDFCGGPRRVVLHTTETTGVPGYDNGQSAPHLTYNPKTRVWTQHTELDVAARAMKNEPGGVQTNRQDALQVEIICYCNKTIADQSPKRLWVGNLPPEALQDIADFVMWAGVPPIWPEKIATSYGQAAAPGFRLDAPTWENFNGVLGHQHVPENTHWDPGALDWNGLMALMVGDGDMTPEQTKFVNDGVKAQKAQGPEYQAAMAALIAAGVFSTTTDPDAPITSEKLAVFLMRYTEALQLEAVLNG